MIKTTVSISIKFTLFLSVSRRCRCPYHVLMTQDAFCAFLLVTERAAPTFIFVGSRSLPLGDTSLETLKIADSLHWRIEILERIEYSKTAKEMLPRNQIESFIIARTGILINRQALGWFREMPFSCNLLNFIQRRLINGGKSRNCETISL